jgi:hypothetical protein
MAAKKTAKKTAAPKKEKTAAPKKEKTAAPKKEKTAAPKRTAKARENDSANLAYMERAGFSTDAAKKIMSHDKENGLKPTAVLMKQIASAERALEKHIRVAAKS